MVGEGAQLHPLKGGNVSYGYILLVPLQCTLKYQCHFRYSAALSQTPIHVNF